MAQIWPDVPELQSVPAELRGVVWMQAYLRSVRSAPTRLLRLLSLGAGVFACGAAGDWAGGWMGAALGGALGCMAGFRAFARIVTVGARRQVRSVLASSDWARSDHPALREACSALSRRGASGPPQ
jgi:hypothetical protein